jgi:hypothetical protein
MCLSARLAYLLDGSCRGASKYPLQYSSEYSGKTVDISIGRFGLCRKSLSTNLTRTKFRNLKTFGNGRGWNESYPSAMFIPLVWRFQMSGSGSRDKGLIHLGLADLGSIFDRVEI